MLQAIVSICRKAVVRSVVWGGHWPRAGFAWVLAGWGLLLTGSMAVAQQEAMYTQYMFNQLAYNPAYAGTKGWLSATALHRDQWAGWGSGGQHLGGSYDGRPMTQTFSLHAPFKNRVGLGITLLRDRIGVHTTTSLRCFYAYHIEFVRGTLSLGLSGGTTHWQARWSDLLYKDPQALDRSFNEGDPDRWLPEFGAGIYYFNDHFYLGLSVPRIWQYPLRFEDTSDDEGIVAFAKLYPHFYLLTGGAIPIGGNPDLVFKPSLLIKSVSLFSDFFVSGDQVYRTGAPTEVDVDAALLLRQTLWVGLSWRTALEAWWGRTSSMDSADLWMALQWRNGLRLGMAYDFPLTAIRPYTFGSFELMVGYDFHYRVDRTLSPRYF